MKTKVVNTDNRDPTTTILILESGLQVEINPLDLFLNMVDNNPDLDIEDVIRQIRALH